MTFVVDVLEATDLHRAELECSPLLRRMRDGRGSRANYTAFLGDLYHVVWHFCPIMAAAASRCTDEFAQVRLHLYEAIHEELGHEKMVLDDLEVFGVDTGPIRSIQPVDSVLALVATNYYLVERVHPCSVLGMSYVLEFIASAYAGPIADGIAEGFGMPATQGFRFLKSHAALDQEHVVRMHSLLNTIRDPQTQRRVIEATNTNFHLFKEWMRQLEDQG